MAKDRDPPKPATSERETKLAQALRANLRRRKTAGGAKPPPSASEKPSASD